MMAIRIVVALGMAIYLVATIFAHAAETICALKDGDGNVVNLIVCPTGPYDVAPGLTMTVATDMDRSWGSPPTPPRKN